MKFLWILFFFPLLGYTAMIEVINTYSKKADERIAEILAIQKSLYLPLETTKIPAHAKNGFLSIQFGAEYLRELFDRGGRFILACEQDQVVGYLLLARMTEYLDWARPQRFESTWDLESLGGIQYIDQIAVSPKFAKHGIGSALVAQAKKLSPQGLCTDILVEPCSNEASLQFFTTRGFSQIGIMHIQATNEYPQHATAVELWIPNKTSKNL